jgi:hypothetical protein
LEFWLREPRNGTRLAKNFSDAGEILGRLLVEALLSDAAISKTFEVYSGPGQGTKD